MNKWFLSVAGALCAATAVAHTTVENLRVCHLEDPSDIVRPVFSWQMRTERRGAEQKAYAIELRTASGGQQALDMVAQEKPDLILLDLMMPGIDGFEVIRRLRENPETSCIQIIILSALNSQEDVVKGFNAGANDFIMKPIIMEKLLTCVVNQLGLVRK